MGILSCKNLVKDYIVGGETFKALDNVSVDVNSGDFIAVTGESGSGKTTLLNMIGLIDKPSAGQIIINGNDVLSEKKDNSSLRNSFFGYVFQNFYLDPNYTAFYNVEIPLIIAGISSKERKIKVSEALDTVGLYNKAKVRCGNLSGGEKQRISIARAIINKPSILLADEPCGNLDSVNTDAIMGLFEQLNSEGTAIVLVTHSYEESLRAKIKITMKDGKIIGVGKN